MSRRTPLTAAAGATLAALVLVSSTACSSSGSSDKPPTGRAASSTLDSCQVVTTGMLTSDLGLTLTGDGDSSPSFYGSSGVTDCAWFDQKTSVTVHATTDPGRDLPESTVQGFVSAGGSAVSGADRGVAYATSDADGSSVTLIVVQGSSGVEVAAATDTTMSQDQAAKLGAAVAAALH